MHQLYILFIALFIFFLLHILLQNISKKKLIRNFTIAFFGSLILLNLFLIKKVEIANLFLLNSSMIFGQFVYLIIIQSFRSSIQIYILNNYKKINLNNLIKEEINIYNYRIKVLKKNKILNQTQKKFKYNPKIILTLTFYFFYIAKVIYNEKFD